MYIGALDSGYFDGGKNLTYAQKTVAADLHLAELLDKMQVHRVPGAIETDAYTCAIVSTWEDWPLITQLNTKLATPIRTGEAVLLKGTIEWVNGEAAVNTAEYCHGGTPRPSDKIRSYSTGGATQSYFSNVELITDGSGNVKLLINDLTNLHVKFHLESFQYVRKNAST